MSSKDISQNSESVKVKPHKLFITGLDGQSDLKDLENDLRKIFGRYGQLQSVVPKRSYNGSYCFAFIDYREGEDAILAVEKENHCNIGGKKITVELQDNSRRRKGAGEGCYQCGKPGHFARDCRSKGSKYRRGRSSESRSDRDRKKRRRRYDSYSSDRSRKKQKRKRSKSRSKKHSKGKKHKKEKRRSYSQDSH